jgi:alpha-mannosidase
VVHRRLGLFFMYAMLTVHVVSHTHWDREWYHPAERFRQRLVELVDELLDDPPTDGASFLLDGQTIVLDDYLAVRPERASELADALRERLLEAGPWFVLADELIPSGEGLVRNLLAGRHTLRALRADAPPVLYCPDSFGHPAALPTLARGFDKTLVILWRGYGGGTSAPADTAWWSSPGGDRVLLYHLGRPGYELGANLPRDPDEARVRYGRIRQELGSRSVTDVALLLNGADHHARQHDLPGALDVLRTTAASDEIIPSCLSDFAGDLSLRAGGQTLPDVGGELRNSYGYTWTLQGTLASRSPQKRRYALRERELLRDVEPWVALAAFNGAASRRHFTRAAWRSVLLCQPHDTLCGCSIDRVARAMDARLESAGTQSEGLREDALFDLVGHDRDDARRRQPEWRAVAIVRNRAPRPRSGVAIVRFSVKLADVPVGPGSKHVRYDKARKRLSHPEWPVLPAQLLDIEEAQERTEAPRSYPDNDAVARMWSAVWVNDVPPYGVLTVPTEGQGQPPAWIEHIVSVKGRSMSNGLLTLRWDAKGSITLESVATRRSIGGLVQWESMSDAGDLYTPSVRTRKFSPRVARTTIVHRGPLSAAVEQHWAFGSARERVDVRLRFVLEAAAGFLRIGVLGDNNARDHRLRLRFRTDVVRGDTFADAAFGPVQRKVLKVPPRIAKAEKVVPTAPLHRYVSLFGAKRGVTLFSDGLTEYETTGENEIVVTLLRAVGELSRSDIPERPGHAGWPAPTPEAQCPGPFEAEFGLLLHGPRNAATTDEIERTADDVLFPLVGDTLRSALAVAPPLHGIELQGEGLAFSAVKESEDGEWMVLRCLNLLEEERAGSWRLGRTPGEALLARLDETPLEPIAIRNDTIAFRAPARGVVTILVR